MRIPRPLSVLWGLSSLVLAGALLHAQPGGSVAEFDVILRHGTIINGTGAAGYAGDVGIKNGYIANIGDLSDRRARLDLDVTGLIVSPGFINIHSHAEPDGLPQAENMLMQGVTTEILGPDGSGPPDIAEQFQRLSEPGLGVNIGAYVGFNSVWSAVVGSEDRRPSAEEIERMRELVIGGLEQGAWGVSAGLDYKPAYYARPDEIVQVLDGVARWRTNFPNHERITPESNFSSRIGISETIAIAEAAGLVPVVTHVKAQGPERGTAAALVGLMQNATARGQYTAADLYPYLAGQTGLGALILPGWAQEGGREQLLERFRDPEIRRRIVREAEQAIEARFCGPESVSLPATQQQLVEVMEELEVSAGEAVVQLLEEENRGAIIRFGRESDLVEFLEFADTVVACDCGASTATRIHPRYYGAFPRVLGRYVREEGLLTWEDAIRKMTGLPAALIGFVDRGFLVPGMVADVTVFDPTTVRDWATSEQPAQLSEEISHVFVNGQLVLTDGRTTGDQAGRLLTRTTHMPSRPMNLHTSRRVSANGVIEGRRVSFDIGQDAGGLMAEGSFQLTDARGTTVIETVNVSLLQVSEQWASFTGRARLLPADEERSITVIVEQNDAFSETGGATVTCAP